MKNQQSAREKTLHHAYQTTFGKTMTKGWEKTGFAKHQSTFPSEQDSQHSLAELHGHTNTDTWFRLCASFRELELGGTTYARTACLTRCGVACRGFVLSGAAAVEEDPDA